MEVLLKNGQSGSKTIHIKNAEKVFSMCFMDVGDLFWFINKSEPSSTKELFDIPATETDIYKLFDDLYKNISTPSIFNNELDNYLKRRLSERNFFNEETKTIEWHSDETYFESDDIVKIIKRKDSYHLEFTRPERYEDPYHMGSSRIISIRFRNSGSYYAPFNIAFMRMYHDAQKLQERGFEDTN